MKELMLGDPVMIAATAAAIGLAIVGVVLLIRRRSPAGSARQSGGAGIGALFKKKKAFDSETQAELRDTLLAADFGPAPADEIIDQLAQHVSHKENENSLETALRDVIAQTLAPAAGSPDVVEDGQIVVIVGINGSGKTTTIAKLTHYLQQQGRKILLGAADTFRAAAAEQLETWGKRLECRVVRQQEGADPAAVAFDTIQAATADDSTVIVDTAGRIHGDQGLMNELSKVIRVIDKARPGAPDHIWLTLDAGQGQTAIEQARKFKDAVPVSGLILNKLDGEGRAGYAIAITRELNLPIIAVGTGEGLENFEPYSPTRHADRIVFGSVTE